MTYFPIIAKDTCRDNYIFSILAAQVIKIPSQGP